MSMKQKGKKRRRRRECKLYIYIQKNNLFGFDFCRKRISSSGTILKTPTKQTGETSDFKGYVSEIINRISSKKLLGKKILECITY